MLGCIRNVADPACMVPLVLLLVFSCHSDGTREKGSEPDLQAAVPEESTEIVSELALSADRVVSATSQIPKPTDTGVAPEIANNAEVVTPPDASLYRPGVLATWQWQLTRQLDTSHDVEIYDIDLFDTPASRIADLQSEGRRIICYFSAGSYEEWRDDANEFNDEDIGAVLSGWPGERWLDIRSKKVRKIMLARLQLAVEKGCDAVEPDNVDGYTNENGLGLTANDQLGYNIFLANKAHAKGLSIGLKNNLDQVGVLVDYFDFAVNEQCHQYNECDALTPFINQGKPVLNAEYQARYRDNAADRALLCADALNRQFSTLVLSINLDDSFRYSCH